MHLMLCFPQCITDMSQVYSSSLNVRKSCKYIILLSGVTRHASERVLQAKRNNSETNIHFAKILVVEH